MITQFIKAPNTKRKKESTLCIVLCLKMCIVRQSCTTEQLEHEFSVHSLIKQSYLQYAMLLS